MNLNLELNKNLDKKSIVFSFERSGTHFLMNTLEKNFGYSSYPWVNLDYNSGMNFYDSKALELFFKQFSGIQVKNIFKSHHAFDFMKDLLPILLEEFHVFYIYRNPLDTLVSYWNYSKKVSWNEAPETENILDFIKSVPKGAMLRYQVNQTDSILKRWEDHISGWLNGIDKFGGIPISYEELNTNFETTVIELSRTLNIPIDNPARPEKESNVVQPNVKKYSIDPKIKKDSNSYINKITGKTLNQFNIKL
jgi:hypothetical protein